MRSKKKYSDLGYKLHMHKHEVISKVMMLILIW